MIKNMLNQKFKNSVDGTNKLSTVQLSYIPGYKISEDRKHLLIFKRIIQPLLKAPKPETQLSIGQAGDVV